MCLYSKIRVLKILGIQNVWVLKIWGYLKFAGTLNLWVLKFVCKELRCFSKFVGTQNCVYSMFVGTQTFRIGISLSVKTISS